MQVFGLLTNQSRAFRLAQRLGARVGRVEIRRFPDGEWYVRIGEPRVDDDCIVISTRPDARLLPLVFTARTLRELGARRVGLVAPYLSYLRQDRRFRDGEAVTSREFAAMLSREIDWLVTVDPHLHRYRSLDEIYSVPTRVAHAAPLLAEWIRANVERPLVIGPDVESEQWVADVANRLGAPFVVLEKTRRGDRDVSVSVPDLERFAGRTPVLVDDIISTGKTMLAAVAPLVARGTPSPVCIGAHGVFAAGTIGAFQQAGVRALVTTNTIPNPTSCIDVDAVLADAVRDLLLELDSVVPTRAAGAAT